MTKESNQQIITKLKTKIEQLETENNKLRKEGTPGIMHPVDQAFYDLTIKERDAAWTKIELLQQEINRLRTNYGLQPINSK